MRVGGRDYFYGKKARALFGTSHTPIWDAVKPLKKCRALTFPSPALLGLSLWKLRLRELVAPELSTRERCTERTVYVTCVKRMVAPYTAYVRLLWTVRVRVYENLPRVRRCDIVQVLK